MYTEQEQQTIDIVERQLEAYNHRDIEALAATYHPEVEIAHFSKGLLYSGRETLIKRYGEKFDGLTYLRATSLKRIVHEQYLVDHELAESSDLASREINRSIKVVAAYEVENGLIKRVMFMG
ncbi:hypothetical protein CRN61_22615 [Vibrio vulnificus]|uniref:nuclear transport factor 2 family protein n=1 Tax=Vibrio vulnificus TaxID=672 RepID=UPI000C9E4E18|nr:nuclear transport factor 2 family protein [Vibrio vulnificus]PNG66443.1 hypothetical protein SC81_03795 [Vibrio vulnificus]POC12375.1 hypothetical protein CRN54_04285 [Vibrio vulnificus]POC77002.1 hypothetical protein CRN61_22615 [Vibrio vulnificus]